MFISHNARKNRNKLIQFYSKRKKFGSKNATRGPKQQYEFNISFRDSLTRNFILLLFSIGSGQNKVPQL
ncbi:hypothetical protein LEP1GSC185_2393 [Leptospira licerasiae serovar Varillal str. VAR 010]|nr:hypothetical protein LEP1GSC185_2393 [Leptospira licerasiae serovar Varillal str. VAR 010]